MIVIVILIVWVAISILFAILFSTQLIPVMMWVAVGVFGLFAVGGLGVLLWKRRHVASLSDEEKEKYYKKQRKLEMEYKIANLKKRNFNGNTQIRKSNGRFG